FDPEPIASNAIATIYQAVLHGTKHSGKKVAVKVQRPNAALHFNAEYLALDWVLRLLPAIAPEYHHALRRIRDEIPRFILKNLDFIHMSRSQRLLRRRLKQSKFRAVGVANVYAGLSNEQVNVSDFVSGVWLHELIGVTQREDHQALQQMSLQDITPERVSKRLIDFSFWMLFENIFLCGSPEIFQIVIKKGGKPIIIDIGPTMTMPEARRLQLYSAYEQMARYDVEGAVDLLLKLLYPLPPVDSYELAKRVEQALWPHLVAMENPESPHAERSGVGLWLAFVAKIRQFRIAIPVETSLFIQTASTFADVSARLTPKFRLLPAFRRYRRKSLVRQARLTSRTMSNNRGQIRPRHRRAGTFASLMRRVRMVLDGLTSGASITYLELTQKGPHAVLQTIWGIMTIAKVTVALMAIMLVWDWLNDRTIDAAATLYRLILNPWYFLVILVLTIITMRRVIVRLEDLERND
ncbi:MAG: AarF/UbiB family protein, partial [Myxococcota bacterium]